MIDFTETPVKEAPSQRRRRRKSKKKVQFSTREILDDKENTVRVETITPLKKNVPTPTGRRLVRRLARASTGLFGTRAAPAPEPRAAPTADAVASTSSPPPSDAAPEARRVEGKEEEEEEALEIEDVAQPSSLGEVITAYERFLRANDDLEALTGRSRRGMDDWDEDAAGSCTVLPFCGIPSCAELVCVDDGAGRPRGDLEDSNHGDSLSDIDEDDLELELQDPCSSCVRTVLLSRDLEAAAVRRR